MITDMVDLIENTTSLRRYLIFENNKNASNGKYYENLVEGLNKRIALYDPPGPIVSAMQARTKFKKIVSECRNVSLTIRTASGIDRHKVGKGYGQWWDVLFQLVASKPSPDPGNNIEPTFEEEEDEGPVYPLADSATHTPPKQKKFIPKRPGGQSASKQSSNFKANLLSTLDKMIENDPSREIRMLIESENEKSRKHELELMKKLLQLSAPRQIPQYPQQFYVPPSSQYQGQPFQQQFHGMTNQSFPSTSNTVPSFSRQVAFAHQRVDVSTSESSESSEWSDKHKLFAS